MLIEEILWSNIYLNFKIRNVADSFEKEEFEFYLVDDAGRAGMKLQIQFMEDHVVWVSGNITNTGFHECLPKGNYCVVVCQKENPITVCKVSPEFESELHSCEKAFCCGKDIRYEVGFSVNGDSDERYLLLNISEYGNAGRASDKKRRVFQKIYNYYRMFDRKKTKSQLLFMTEQSYSLSENFMAVINRVKERRLEDKFSIACSARKVSDKTASIKEWVNLVKKIAKSDVIFLDDYAPILDWLEISKGTKVVQLWHAGVGFKASGYSRWGHTGAPQPKSCYRKITYGIAGSRTIAPIFAEIWGINPEYVLPTGLPRMDKFLDLENKKRVVNELYERYPLCKDKKVILFAPTYRGKSNADAHYPYEKIDLQKLRQVCGTEYVVLFKMHPWVKEPIDIPDCYKDVFVDVQSYPDINELYYITDLLITDYSSNIYEFSLMKKPMLFYAFDKEEYALSRGFHNEYNESAPGRVCETFSEVVEAIVSQEFNYHKVEKYVKDNFEYVDMNSADRVIDWILLNQMPETEQREIRRIESELKVIKEKNFDGWNGLKGVF